jgi:hypothetical protein
VAEVLCPTRAADGSEVAQLTARLYRTHDAMLPIARSRWRDRLDQLANSPVGPTSLLLEVLQRFEQSQHVLIDALGLPLLPAVLEQIEALFPDWRLTETTFARIEGATTTDACYHTLAEAGFDRKLEKINRVDTLLHERFLPFDEFARLALAELAIACRATRARLDPRSPLLIFADHGFRLSADGRSYHHGGTSTLDLEQLVPILHLTPR